MIIIIITMMIYKVYVQGILVVIDVGYVSDRLM